MVTATGRTSGTFKYGSGRDEPILSASPSSSMISVYLCCTAALVSALMIFCASSEDLMARSETTVSTESWLSTIPFKSEAGVWFVIPSMNAGAFSDEYLGVY